MKLERDKCLKCGAVIIQSGRPLSSYKALGYNTEDGNVCFIGFCTNCELLKEDYEAASKACGIPLIHSYWGDENKIPEVKTSPNCDRCNKTIEGNFITNMGKVWHERCPNA